MKECSMLSTMHSIVCLSQLASVVKFLCIFKLPLITHKRVFTEVLHGRFIYLEINRPVGFAPGRAFRHPLAAPAQSAGQGDGSPA